MNSREPTKFWHGPCLQIVVQPFTATAWSQPKFYVWEGEAVAELPEHRFGRNPGTRLCKPRNLVWTKHQPVFAE